MAVAKIANPAACCMLHTLKVSAVDCQLSVPLYRWKGPDIGVPRSRKKATSSREHLIRITNLLSTTSHSAAVHDHSGRCARLRDIPVSVPKRNNILLALSLF